MKQQNRTPGHPGGKPSNKQRPYKDSVGRTDKRKRHDEGAQGSEPEGKPRFNRDKPTYRKPAGDQAERRFQGGDTDKPKRYDNTGQSGESEGKPRFNRDKPTYRKPAGDQAERRFKDGDTDKPKRYDNTGQSGESEGKPRFNRDKPTYRKTGGDQAERRFRTGDTDKRKRYDDAGQPGDSEGKPHFNRDKPTYRKPGRDQAERRFQDGDTDKRKRYDEGAQHGESDKKPRFNKEKSADHKPGRDQAERRFQGRDTDKPKRYDDAGQPGEAEGKKRFSKDKPGYRKPGADKEQRFQGGEQKPGFKKDTRPFRQRTTPAAAKPEAPASPSFGEVVKKAFNQPKKTNDIVQRQQFEDKVYGELKDDVNNAPPPRPYEVSKKFASNKESSGNLKPRATGKAKKEEPVTAEMPLNKYIAHSGECSRRDAGELVKQGKVKVNGELVLDPGYRVKSDDSVTMSGKKLTPQKDHVYILLNKPKGFITTNDDPQGRRTVMQLVENSGVDRLFPIGRLDRDTTGLLLITNDGALTQKLSHPSYQIKKVYQVTLDKPLTKADFEKVIAGVELDDGKAEVDTLAYLEQKNELGLEIHSGRNRIVRRIFESLGYVVEKLDRVMYAGLTKKNLPRSKWRFLEPREVILLKHFKS